MDQWLRNTNVVKVVALVIGILLWAVVHMEDRSVPGSGTNGLNGETIISNVAVTPRYNTEQLYIESIEPAQVSVILTGRNSTIKKAMNSGTYSVEADLTALGKGEHTQVLTPVGFPSGVTVKITPSTVRVVLDEKKNKSMPVNVKVTGTPAEGLKAGQPVVKPNRVTVTVPSKLYDAVETVSAEVSVANATAAVSNKARLVAYDKNGKPLEMAEISPAVVDVEVPVTSPFKLVPLQLKLVGEPPQGFAVESLKQNPDKVTVFGPQNVLDPLEFYEGPQVDLSQMKENSELTLDIPVHSKEMQLEPDQVTVSVTIVPSVTHTIEGVPISIIGQNDGFNTQVVSPSSRLNVVVEGAPTIVNKLKAQDVQAILDVSNLPPGRHNLTVAWNLPTFVKKAPQQEYTVTVEISAKQGQQTPAPPEEEPAGPPPPAEEPPAAPPGDAAGAPDTPASGGSGDAGGAADDADNAAGGPSVPATGDAGTDAGGTGADTGGTGGTDAPANPADPPTSEAGTDTGG